MRLLSLFLLLALPAWAGSPLALGEGERLNFRVGWGIFLNAGEIDIKARTEVNDARPCTVVATTTSSRGMLRRLFKFEAQAESIFDQGTGRMLLYTESSASAKKKTNIALELNYAAAQIRYTDYINTARSSVNPMPPGESPLDLIMSLIQTRTWDLKPGEKKDINVTFDDDIYELTIHALRYEEVTTKLGTFTTLLYQPRMERTPPKGMFKRGSAVHVWIAQDAQRLPVKFEVEFKFGAGIATLVAYDPPKTSAGAGVTDAAAVAPAHAQHSDS